MSNGVEETVAYGEMVINIGCCVIFVLMHVRFLNGGIYCHLLVQIFSDTNWFVLNRLGQRFVGLNLLSKQYLRDFSTWTQFFLILPEF
jgi:hypothetical protein